MFQLNFHVFVCAEISAFLGKSFLFLVDVSKHTYDLSGDFFTDKSQLSSFHKIRIFSVQVVNFVMCCILRIIMGRAFCKNGRREDCFQNLAGKPTGKTPLGRSRCRWEDNIRMDLEEIGINAGNLVDSAQDRNH